MRSTGKRAISWTLCNTGLLRLIEFLTPPGVVVLMFHRVMATESDTQSPNSPLMVDAENFDRLIQHITQKGRAISLDVAAKGMLSPKPSTVSGVVVTFDDGYRDNYDIAFPILKKYRCPATIFLSTECLDKRDHIMWWDEVSLFFKSGATLPQDVLDALPPSSARRFNELVTRPDRHWMDIKNFIRQDLRNLTPEKLSDIIVAMRSTRRGPVSRLMLNWNECREMADTGLVALAPHTATHPFLSNISLDEANIEVQHSMERIHASIGSMSPYFAYPGGLIPEFFQTLCLNNNLKVALTTTPGKWTQQTNRFLVPRVDARYCLINGQFDHQYFDLSTSVIASLRRSTY